MTHPLRAWREAKGLSQTQVADELGITQRSVSRIEHGGSTDYDKLRAIYHLTQGGVTPTCLVMYAPS